MSERSKLLDSSDIALLLRQFRIEAGLTQEALAERAGLGSRSIQGIESGERRPHRETIQRLVEALRLGDGDRDRFEAAAQAVPRQRRGLQLVSHATDRPVQPEPVVRSSGRLPVPLTSFIGRESDLAEIRRCLLSSRLLTLSGPPGIGKTRLAQEVATIQVETFVDGVRFLSVAAIRDPQLLLSAIAQAIGVEGTERQLLLDLVIEAMRDWRCLFILDNFEQVMTGAPLISHILESCPQLKMLVTSRMRLGVRGEREFVVAPLSLPDTDQPEREGRDPVTVVLQSEAGRLFVERASAARRDFSLTSDNASIVAAICRHLGGVPLAIELAAPWVRILSLPGLLSRLTDRLSLFFAGPADLPLRQQTMWNAITWSDELLNDGERLLFRRLAVFSGGFTFPAAEAICEARLAGFTSLLDMSLIYRMGSATAVDEAEQRFGMLEIIREYARAGLTDDETKSLQNRHAAYFFSFAEAAKTEFYGPLERDGLDRLESEHDNLRAALRLFLDEADAERAFRLANVLEWLWTIRGYIDEARRWLVRLLELAWAAGRTKDQANVLRLSGRMALKQSDYAAAWARLEESMVLSRKVGDRHGVAESLAYLGLVAHARGEYAVARSRAQESLELYRELGDAWGVGAQLDRVGMATFYLGDVATARALVEESLVVRQRIGDQNFTDWARELLGELAHACGDYATARSYYERTLASWRDQGYREGMTAVLPNLGDLALDEGDLSVARSYLIEAVQVSRAVGSPSGMIQALEGFAGLAAAQNEAERCLRLAGAASALRETISEPCPPDRRARLTRRIERARDMLGKEATAAAWAQGTEMTLDQAAAYALRT